MKSGEFYMDSDGDVWFVSDDPDNVMCVYGESYIIQVGGTFPRSALEHWLSRGWLTKVSPNFH